jgi:hypothetical protein
MAGLSKVKGSGLATGAATASLVGIDDNATSTKITISDTNITGVGAFTSTSIDATKLSGALPAIDGSALTGMPAGGKVLQVVSSRFTTGYSHNSTTFVDVGHSITVTPLSSTSTLYITLTCQLSINGCNGIVAAIREGSNTIGGSASGDSNMFVYNDNATNNRHWQLSTETYTASTGTTSRTFKVSTKVTQGGPGTNSCKYDQGWGPAVLTVTEVA